MMWRLSIPRTYSGFNAPGIVFLVRRDDFQFEFSQILYSAICLKRSQFKSILPGRGTATYAVTTPIFYVNAEPHIGHLYTSTIADAKSRWEQMKGRNVIFSTGTDEHGIKIQKAAGIAGKEIGVFCSEISNRFKQLFQSADINYTYFIRTTDTSHRLAVEHFWNELTKRGFIYTGNYEGWYSTSDEAFLTSQQVDDARNPSGDVIKVSKESGNPVEWTQERNYMFKLGNFRQQLLEWIAKDIIQPVCFRPVVENWLSELEDLSISREAGRLKWGIPVPNDPTQTIYVWLDALVNYLTVCGYPRVHHWPVNCHVVGKDILKFHAVYWPAFLMAAGFRLPEKIFCHSHWTVDNVKMSKSLGNVVDPFDRLRIYGVDGLRYFLLKEGVAHNDGNYNDHKVVELLNSDLCNTLGNLLSRCTGLALNPEQMFPAFNQAALDSILDSTDQQWFQNLYSLADNVDVHYTDINFYKGLDLIMERLRQVNAFVQKQQPWTLKNLPEQNRRLNAVLHVVLESLRISGLLLQPVCPRLSDRLLSKLGVDRTARTYDNCKRCIENLPLNLGVDSNLLFSRIK